MLRVTVIPARCPLLSLRFFYPISLISSQKKVVALRCLSRKSGKSANFRKGLGRLELANNILLEDSEDFTVEGTMVFFSLLSELLM